MFPWGYPYDFPEPRADETPKHRLVFCPKCGCTYLDNCRTNSDHKVEPFPKPKPGVKK